MQVASAGRYYFFFPTIEDQEPVKFGVVYRLSVRLFPATGHGYFFLKSNILEIKFGHSARPSLVHTQRACTSTQTSPLCSVHVHACAARVHARSTPTRARSIVTHAAGSSALERLRPLHRNPRNTRLARLRYLLATGYLPHRPFDAIQAIFFDRFDSSILILPRRWRSKPRRLGRLPLRLPFSAVTFIKILIRNYLYSR